MKAIVATLVCFSIGVAHADDKAAAEALFVNAKKAERAGDMAAACPLFEASYRADPQLGVLLNLANCHEAIGRTGVAWAEFREGIEMAARKTDPREDYARRRAAALEAHLVRLHVDVDATPGLVIHRNDVDVTSLVAQDVVVDPGSYTIEATAPGYRAWSTSIDVRREGATETVHVPALEAAPVAAPPPKPAPPPHPVMTMRRETSPLRTWAFVVGGVGLGVVGTGLGLGAYAWSEWSGTRDPSVCDHSNICSPAGQAQIAAAKSHARTSTYLVAAGGATVAASIVMLWLAPSSEHLVMPAVDDHGASVSIAGRF
ncbi:MAG: hypothetical protein QM831_18255 [Kofleriaceae bacterium]